ncbi:hypothetical protein AB0H34_02340 [Saccharopolyspora shandongensis]|uniref:hypothetical protein n=1 Tax=Saccharopolyspora shandongensis TaxID=418495 RepID=UPI0033C6A195
MNPQQHIADARAALGAAYLGEAGDPVVVLADLAAIAELLGDLAEQARRDLASWATVGPHLTQAGDHAVALARSLQHAGGTLAYNYGAAVRDGSPATMGGGTTSAATGSSSRRFEARL